MNLKVLFELSKSQRTQYFRNSPGIPLQDAENVYFATVLHNYACKQGIYRTFFPSEILQFVVYYYFCFVFPLKIYFQTNCMTFPIIQIVKQLCWHVINNLHMMPTHIDQLTNRNLQPLTVVVTVASITKSFNALSSVRLSHCMTDCRNVSPKTCHLDISDEVKWLAI